MRLLTSAVKGITANPIEVHCHNDYGLAVANSIAAVEAGASVVSTTANGLGEGWTRIQCNEPKKRERYIQAQTIVSTGLPLHMRKDSSIPLFLEIIEGKEKS